MSHKLYLKDLVYEFVYYGFMHTFLFQSPVKQIISRLEDHLGPHLDQGPGIAVLMHLLLNKHINLNYIYILLIRNLFFFACCLSHMARRY